MAHQVFDSVAEKLVAKNWTQLVCHVRLHEVPAVIGWLKRNLK
jgi:hypothetical protein